AHACSKIPSPARACGHRVPRVRKRGCAGSFGKRAHPWHVDWKEMVEARRCATMWKTIVLCALLFASAALGLAAAARWLEPSVLPATAAIGVCLIGVVLILLSPHRPEAAPATEAAPVLSRLEALEEAPVTALHSVTSGNHPTLH